MLIILDGWGINQPNPGNAISQAKILNLEKIEKNYPSCALQSSGIAVGLPWNEAGNSEVGHLNIGAGRIVYQSLPRISMTIKDGSFFKNIAFIKTLNHVKQNNSVLHLMGLVSSGNVHSHLEHLYAILELAKRENIKKLCLHVFTDGKDAPLKEGKKIIANLQEKIKNSDWKIATIIGRFYAMDRNNNWDRTEKTYNLLTQGQGEKTQNPIKKLEEFYEQDITDTYIPPIVVVDDNQNPLGTIKNNDAIISFNFREDSMRQITKVFINGKLKNLLFCAMTEYEKGLPASPSGGPIEVAYPPIEIENHLTEILNNANKKILKIAETEKYAHVTYFFNGGKEKPYPNEDRKLIPSKIVSYYDDYPEMQAKEITKAAIEGIKNNYDLIVINYANPDMIGHTGNLKAAIKSAEYIDKAIKPLIELAEKDKCILIITSDHGNIEQMINLQTGELLTEHTINPVPFYLVGKEFKKSSFVPTIVGASEDKPSGLLSDIAPTILELLKIPQPPEMTGRSLLEILK